MTKRKDPLGLYTPEQTALRSEYRRRYAKLRKAYGDDAYVCGGVCGPNRASFTIAAEALRAQYEWDFSARVSA